jgi:hypothetical protein
MTDDRATIALAIASLDADAAWLAARDAEDAAFDRYEADPTDEARDAFRAAFRAAKDAWKLALSFG